MYLFSEFVDVPQNNINVPIDKQSLEEYKVGNRYYCPCGRNYSLRTNLRQHMTYDCGKEPRFSCPYCPLKLRRMNDLRRHISRRHKDVE